MTTVRYMVLENVENKARQLYGTFSDEMKLKARGQVANATAMRLEGGDLSLELQYELNGEEYTATVIRMAVGKLYEVTYHTVRGWERVCKVVDDGLRGEYDYSFEYWRAMCGAPIPGLSDEDFLRLPESERDRLKRDRVRELAGELAEYAEAFGMPPVSTVWGWGREGDYIKFPWQLRVEGDLARASLLIEDERTPPVLRAYYGIHRGVLQHYLDTGEINRPTLG